MRHTHDPIVCQNGDHVILETVKKRATEFAREIGNMKAVHEVFDTPQERHDLTLVLAKHGIIMMPRIRMIESWKAFVNYHG